MTVHIMEICFIFCLSIRIFNISETKHVIKTLTTYIINISKVLIGRSYNNKVHELPVGYFLANNDIQID